MDKAFQTFIDSIKLNSSQREDARKKYDGVCKKLHERYYPNSNYDGTTRFLIGSYGKGTHIKPARDVDVIFSMPPEKFSEYDDNQSNCQSQLLQDVRRLLQEKYPNTPVKAWSKVVVLEFSDPQHNIEVQPAWRQSDGRFLIPNSESSGSWEFVDPRAEIKAIQDSDQSTGKTRSLIRTIKKWSEQSTVSVTSYEIEQNVLHFLHSRETSQSYSELVKDFFEFFLACADNDGLKSHLATALGRAQKACDLEQDSKLLEASLEWRKVLGDSFPKSESEKYTSQNTEEEMIKRLSDKYPSSVEQFIDRDYGYPIAIEGAYIIDIDSYVTKLKGFRPGWLSKLMNNNSLWVLLKKISLEFQVTKINVPEPYSLYWKIRNFGDEAETAEGLRGEITRDSGYGKKKESTLYRGTHLVECYVIKDGTCVAIGRRFVPIGVEIAE